MAKNPPAKQEMQVRSLGWEDPLKKEMVTHASILAWEIPWTEELAGCSPWGHKRVRRDLVTKEQQQLKVKTKLMKTNFSRDTDIEKPRGGRRGGG